MYDMIWEIEIKGLAYWYVYYCVLLYEIWKKPASAYRRVLKYL